LLEIAPDVRARCLLDNFVQPKAHRAWSVPSDGIHVVHTTLNNCSLYSSTVRTILIRRGAVGSHSTSYFGAVDRAGLGISNLTVRLPGRIRSVTVSYV
jgi:hypothetical protein